MHYVHINYNILIKNASSVYMYPTMEKYCTILIINEMAIWWIRNASIRIPLLIFNPEPKLNPHSNVGKFLVKKNLENYNDIFPTSFVYY